MKNLRFLIPIALSSIMMTGCTMSDMPWSKKEPQQEQNIFDDYQSSEELASQDQNQPEDNLGEPPLTEGEVPPTESTILDAETELPDTTEDTSQVSFGDNLSQAGVAAGPIVPDLTVVPTFTSETPATPLSLNNLNIAQSYTAETTDSDGYVSYKLAPDVTLRLAEMPVQDNIDTLADSVISAPSNSGFKCTKSSVTLCGTDARMITANASSAPNSSIILLFNNPNSNTAYLLQVQYPKEKDGMSVATPIFNSISLPTATTEFGASAQQFQIAQSNTQSMPYSIQLKDNKSYLDFANLTFKEPEGGLRDDTFCAKGAENPNVTNMVSYTFPESKCTFTYTTENISSSTEQIYLDRLVSEAAEKSKNPSLLLTKAATLPSEPYMLNYADGGDDIQQFIFVKDNIAHVLTYRLVGRKNDDATTIQDTLKSILIK